jgi:hypothetical protein
MVYPERKPAGNADGLEGGASMAVMKKTSGRGRGSAAKRTAPRKATARRGAGPKTARKATLPRERSGRATRTEPEFPQTLRDFSRRLRRQLNALEGNIEKTEWRYRRQATRALRDASHRLGKFEAMGERAWRKLTAQARREVLGVLRRVEKAIEGPEAPPARATRPSAGKAPARRRPSSLESSGSGI